MKQTKFQVDIAGGTPFTTINPSINAQTAVSCASGGSTNVLAAFATRRFAMVVNPSATATLFVGLGVNGTANGVPVPPHQSFVLERNEGAIFVGAINVYQASGAPILVGVLEF